MDLKTKFPWFYKFPIWGKVVFWLFFYPFIIGVLLWLGIKNKTIKYVVVGTYAIIAIGFFGLVGSAKPSVVQNAKTEEVKKVEVAKTPEELAQEKADQEAKAKADDQKKIADEAKKKAEEDKKKAEELAKANRTPDEKVAELAGQVFKDKGYSSKLSDTTAILSYNTAEGAFWDEKHYLESMLEDFAKFGKEASKIDKVTGIEVNYRAELIDSFGTGKDGNLMLINMTKENFLKYNFDNIQGDLFYNSVSKNAYIFILPSTRAKIDFSKVKVYL